MEMATYKDYRNVEEVVEGTRAINNSIRNILTTRLGSVPGKPTFGSRLDEVLFSQMDHVTISILKNLIRESLANFEPRIAVTAVDIKSIQEFNKVTAAIHYSYNDNSLEMNELINISLTQ